MIKNTQQTRNGKKFPQPDKGIYENPTDNIINGERLKAFWLRSGIRRGCLLLPLLLNIVREVIP